jgi:hypothetical protein
LRDSTKWLARSLQAGLSDSASGVRYRVLGAR